MIFVFAISEACFARWKIEGKRFATFKSRQKEQVHEQVQWSRLKARCRTAECHG